MVTKQLKEKIMDQYLKACLVILLLNICASYTQCKYFIQFSASFLLLGLYKLYNAICNISQNPCFSGYADTKMEISYNVDQDSLLHSVDRYGTQKISQRTIAGLYIAIFSKLEVVYNIKDISG